MSLRERYWWRGKFALRRRWNWKIASCLPKISSSGPGGPLLGNLQVHDMQDGPDLWEAATRWVSMYNVLQPYIINNYTNHPLETAIAKDEVWSEVWQDFCGGSQAAWTRIAIIHNATNYYAHVLIGSFSSKTTNTDLRKQVQTNDRSGICGCRHHSCFEFRYLRVSI